MRVEETFSRFHDSFSFNRANRPVELASEPAWPGFYLYEHERIAIYGDYINFSASCPPVALQNLPTRVGEPFRDERLPCPAGSPGHDSFWYSEGSMARAMKRFRFSRRSITSPSFMV